MESWENHFMDLLEETKRRAVLNLDDEEKEEREEKEEEIQDITKEELMKHLKKLKIAQHQERMEQKMRPRDICQKR